MMTPASALDLASQNGEASSLAFDKPAGPMVTDLSFDAAAAEQMLGAARGELSAGRFGVAQRLLEQAIALYPRAPVIVDLRRELHRVYAGQPQIAAAPVVAARHSASDPLTAQIQPSGDRRGWRTSSVGRASRTDELRSTVGDRVFFESGDVEFGPRALTVIAAQAAWLARNGDLVAIVEGHADRQEQAALDELSRQRAEIVRRQLIVGGVDIDRVRIVQFGASEPVAVCGDDGACASQNRRTVVRLETRAASEPPPASSGPAAVDKSR